MQASAHKMPIVGLSELLDLQEVTLTLRDIKAQGGFRCRHCKAC